MIANKFSLEARARLARPQAIMLLGLGFGGGRAVRGGSVRCVVSRAAVAPSYRMVMIDVVISYSAVSNVRSLMGYVARPEDGDNIRTLRDARPSHVRRSPEILLGLKQMFLNQIEKESRGGL